MKLRLVWNIAGACGFIALAVQAGAHPSRAVRREEMTVLRDRIVLFLRYEVSEPRFAADLRERFDADGDRALTSAEQGALAGYISQVATRDLNLLWDGRPLRGQVTIERSWGLERLLPSAYPVDFLLRLEFAVQSKPGWHEIAFSDAEPRWQSGFACRVMLAPGLESDPPPQAFEFAHGQGRFQLKVRFAK